MEQMNEGLKVVLLGRTGAGKSSSGNTILGRDVFMSKKSSRSVTIDVAVESGTVDGFPVTVYDTPGLFDTEMREDEVQKKLEDVLQGCESGPCVFLLVIKADRFTEEERRTVEKIEQILGEKRLRNIWILFTRGDELEEENMTIQEFINETEALKNLVEKYEQRYCVFNNKTKKQTRQAQILLMKILLSYLDKQESEIPELLKPNPLRRKDPKDLDLAVSGVSRRIVLLGKTGAGKSAAGNTILGEREFISLMRMNSVTHECSEAHVTVSGRSVSVVDTPGFFDTDMKHEDLMREIARSVYLSSPGPHSFLIVLPVNMRYTDQEQQIPQIIEMMFGQEVLKYSIILFTHGDQLKGQSVEDLIKENVRLRSLVDQCGGRYQVFNNEDLRNREQVKDLLKKIDSMVEQNGGGHYSNQMYEDALRFRQEEEEERRREEEERRQEEEKRIQEELERVRKETEEKARAEMEAELERLREENQRKKEELEKKMQEELERARRKMEEKFRAERQRHNSAQGGFSKFFKNYWHYILIGAAVGALTGGLGSVVFSTFCCKSVIYGAAAGAGVGLFGAGVHHFFTK